MSTIGAIILLYALGTPGIFTAADEAKNDCVCAYGPRESDWGYQCVKNCNLVLPNDCVPFVIERADCTLPSGGPGKQCRTCPQAKYVCDGEFIWRRVCNAECCPDENCQPIYETEYDRPCPICIPDYNNCRWEEKCVVSC